MVFEAASDIFSFQIREDGLIFMVYKTSIIDILRPTSEGAYERVHNESYKL